MFLIDAINPNVEIQNFFTPLFRGGKLGEYKKKFVSFRVRFVSSNKNIMYKIMSILTLLQLSYYVNQLRLRLWKLLWLIFTVVAKSEQLKINDCLAFHLIITYIQLLLIIVSIHTRHYPLKSKYWQHFSLPYMIWGAWKTSTEGGYNAANILFLRDSTPYCKFLKWIQSLPKVTN